MSNKKTNLWVVIAFNVVTISALLIAAEAFFRFRNTHLTQEKGQKLSEKVVIDNDPSKVVYWTPKGNRLIPNTKVVIKNHYLTKRDITISINSLGFRDEEFSKEKPKDEFRIVVIGDSITWGNYLQAEEVYVKRLQHYINKELQGSPFNFVRVINTGVGDLGIVGQLDILEKQALKLKPDLVIHAFYLNDSRPPWGFRKEEGSRGFWRKNSVIIDKIYRNLKFRKWVKDQGSERFAWVAAKDTLNWKSQPADFKKFTTLARYDWGAAWQNDSWEIVKSEMKKLKQLSQSHNFKVLTVNFPVRYQVEAEKLYNEPQLKMQSLATASGFEFFDLLPTMRIEPNFNWFLDNCHPGKEANDKIAKSIFQYIKEKKLIP